MLTQTKIAEPTSVNGINVDNLSALIEEVEAQAIEAAFLKAYRWQYIHSGAQHPHFRKVLSSLIAEKQGQRIQAALATLQ